MSKPGEHKTVQARILKYAQECGWVFVSREEADARRGKVADSDKAPPSLFFDDLLDAKVREFNPDYADAEGALLGAFKHLHTDIYGNREFVELLRNRGKFLDHEEKRERDLILIDYDDPARNVYEVTEEWAFHNGHYGTREDVVFLINGIPVLAIECKNASKDEAIALGVDQIRRYHRETPELFVSQQIFTATDAIGFSYGVTWNTVRRNIFNWKHEEVGKLEAKVKSFCAIPQVLALLKDYIVFAEKDEELNKYILRQHQTGAVEATVARALDPRRTRGLVWHTQGSGKTFTMIKAAERLFRTPEADKPTVLLMIDRNELEDQMLKNLAALGLGNLEHAGSIARLNQLLRDDYRGIIVTMIHKFRDMPADLNTRSNIYVLIDEAHRTTGGDLGNFLMAGLPNATFIGFTGTPVDRTAYGKGTFKTFGCEDDKGYLHKYSIADSIEDGTTLPLYYQLAPNEMLVPHETLDKEFLSLAEAEGVADIEELNKILERAVNLKNFLKGKDRIQKVAEFSPDAFLRPYLDDYATLSSIYDVVRKAYSKTVYVDRSFQKKTNELVQKHVGAVMEGESPEGFVTIDAGTIELIKNQSSGKATKVINLIKSIEKAAGEQSGDPFLIGLADRAQAVQESFENRQVSTEEALDKLIEAVAQNEKRKQEQAARGLDNLTYFVLCKLTDVGIAHPDLVSKNIAAAFARNPNWQRSDNALRELRKRVTFAIYAEEDDMNKVSATVEELFNLLNRAFKT